MTQVPSLKMLLLSKKNLDKEKLTEDLKDDLEDYKNSLYRY